ncbi:MAG: DUF192 domain-containing protein [Deltaproteobacteria bacterium]|nr:DUF192 domain-containing protein [Deltaproteobacteria bacterium]PWB67417.1 MAG: hypothetical protein C3F14_02250 [Deltaproteobacteria bacterium]
MLPVSASRARGRTVTAANRTKGSLLGDRIGVADGFFRRLAGLLGRPPLSEGEGLWITPCSSVHSIGMRYPIDVLFLDVRGKVVGACPGLPPGRLSRLYFGAKGALELPEGTLSRTGTEIGDTVEFQEAPDVRRS